MSKTILTQEQEREIVYKYTVLNISKNKLHLEYNVSEGTIKRALQRNGIHIRTIQETNISKYNINKEIFKIDRQSPNSAYILGLLASDGYVSSINNAIYIELQQSDRQILEDVNKALNNERPVKDYVRANGYKNSKLYFFSKEMKEDLKQYNIVPNKTYLNLNFFQNVRRDLFPHFLRGFFDGDGSITWCETIRWQLDGASILTFKTIQDILLNDYNIETKIEDTTDSTCSIPRYRIYTYSKQKAEQLFNILYSDDNCLKLKRKYIKFLELLKRYRIPRESALLNQEDEKIC